MIADTYGECVCLLTVLLKLHFDFLAYFEFYNYSVECISPIG